MFTGIVEEVGVIRSVEPNGDGRSFVIEASKVLQDLAVDNSVAVNGVCLTVTERDDKSFRVDTVAETLRKTTLRNKTAGRRVNLERAVRLHDRLGGHIVQGHVDATGVIAGIETNSLGAEVWIAFPTAFKKWLIPVGSVTVNGVALTIAELDHNQFKVALIPHTLQTTTLEALVNGQEVNLEFDLIAKYIESIVMHKEDPNADNRSRTS